MQQLQLNGGSGNDAFNGRRADAPRILGDILAVAFRRRMLIAISFLGVLLGATVIAILQPDRYDSSMKILVKRDRADPVVTPDSTSVAPSAGEVTEEELNSEVAILKSRDLLERIVIVCNLQQQRKTSRLGLLARFVPSGAPHTGIKSTPDALPASASIEEAGDDWVAQYATNKISDDRPISLSDAKQPGLPCCGSKVAFNTVNGLQPVRSAAESVAIAKAVLTLEKELRVEVLKKTNLIEASYEAADPRVAARVLSTLANLYAEKHVAVHRPSGAFGFFQRETAKYRQELAEAEKRLLDFNRDAAVVSAPMEKEFALQRLAEFEVTLNQTNAGIAEAQQRIKALQEKAKSTPSRMVTQIRNADDGMLVSQLRGTLVTLEQKRIELLAKFEPTYRPVQELDQEIERVRAALKENLQVHEETTDVDPTYQWIRAESAKANADLASLQARAEATTQAIRSYQENARSLASKEVAQSDLMRAIKAAEENYSLYQRKEEEARISDALDRGRILNVAIAEAPTVPALPSNHRLQTIAFGFLFAIVVSAALAFLAERMDGTFRTADELASILDIPVLAAVPRGGLAPANMLRINAGSPTGLGITGNQ